MDRTKLRPGEYVSMGGGLLLALSLLLTWFHVDRLATLGGTHGPADVSGLKVSTILAVLLLGAAIAPFILAWIIVRDHALSWPRGEMTAVVSVAAFGLVAYSAFVSKPGDPNSLVHDRIGVYLAIIATILMFAGAALRSSDVERKRKPPGTI
jgi:hypothetical protein